LSNLLFTHSRHFRVHTIFIYLKCSNVSDGTTLNDDSRDGEIMFAIRSYLSENNDALDLVEGEKVYVIGNFFI